MKKALPIVLSLSMVVSSGVIQPVFVHADQAISVTNEEELKAALDDNTTVEAIDITESFTIHDDCMIQLDPSHINYYSDTVVTIDDGVTLTIEDGGKLGSFWPSYEGDWQTGPFPF